MNIRFVPEAVKDLDDAFEWYESEQKGLGKRFVLIIDESILRIARYPLFNTKVKPAFYQIPLIVVILIYNFFYTL